jgi:hypothetical protein
MIVIATSSHEALAMVDADFKTTKELRGYMHGPWAGETQLRGVASVTMTSFNAGAAVRAGVAVIVSAVAGGAEPQRASTTKGCDELFRVRGLVWRGTGKTMTLQQLASYVAPVLWFSPDEPALEGRRGRDIRVPAALPFDASPDGPSSTTK